MIPDEEPPDWEPDERECPFDDQHLMPVILTEQPGRDWSGTGNRQRLTKIPISIGASALGTRKPIGQQDEGCRKNTTLRHAEKKPHQFELPEGLGHPAPDRADAPGDQENAYDLARAPARCPIATTHLQQNVSKKEN